MRAAGKHLVVIVSAGRTGTRFFGDTLSGMIAGSYSAHEPDVFEGFTRRTWNRVRQFGLHHMLLGRITGSTGLRSLSEGFLGGRLDLDQVTEALRRQRLSYYEDLDADPILESYYQWYGILPALPRLVRHYKVVGVVRDPRTWVTSNMNYGSHYGKRDWVSRLGLRRLDPAMVGDLHYVERWPEMSRFERLCWTWNTVYRIIGDFVRKDENARLWRYEDLFLSEGRVRNVEEMLAFMTSFQDRSFEFELDPTSLDRRINSSKPEGFRNWPDWSQLQARQLDAICGPLMKSLGYGTEPDWEAKLGLETAGTVLNAGGGASLP